MKERREVPATATVDWSAMSDSELVARAVDFAQVSWDEGKPILNELIHRFRQAEQAGKWWKRVADHRARVLNHLNGPIYALIQAKHSEPPWEAENDGE